jgi:hypothetical protein
MLREHVDSSPIIKEEKEEGRRRNLHDRLYRT